MWDALNHYANTIAEFSPDPIDNDIFNRYEEFYKSVTELFRSVVRIPYSHGFQIVFETRTDQGRQQVGQAC